MISMNTSCQPERNSIKCPVIPVEKISDDQRLGIWMACLNVSCNENKPYEYLDSEVMDLVPNLTQIVDFGNEVADRFDGPQFLKESIKLEMINILSYHSGKTKITFDPLDGWHDLLEPIVYLKGSEVAKYRIFEAILKRYVPQRTDYMTVVRLLLNYHDPQLHTFLKSKQMTLEDYPFVWINRLFAQLVPPPLIFIMWDRYIIEKNRFLIFFLSTALMITFRDKIMSYQNEDKDNLILKLWALPANINVDNLSDLYALANNLKIKTPAALINKLCPIIFGVEKDENSLLDNLCWSVTVEELIKSMDKTSVLSAISDNIKFIVVDCRSQEEYDAGHLPIAYPLDYNLRVTHSIQFSDKLESLFDLQQHLLESDVKVKHFCFMDSGREEHKKYTDMVIRACQRRNIKYVNLLIGGYKALHDHFGDRVENFIVNHDEKRCKVCSENAPPVTVNRLTRLKSQGEEFVNRLRASKSTVGMDEELRSPSRLVKSKSMYENPHTSITKWLEDPNLVMDIKCKEFDSSNKQHNCHLIITRDYLIALREMPDREDAAEISVKRPLTSIVSIKAKKRNKNIIVIKYNAITKADDLVVNNASEFLFLDSSKAMQFFSGEYFRTLLIPYSRERFFNKNA